jgi:DNA-directed RNA polymerase subunit alpha
MSQNAVAVDVGSLLQSLKFTSADLSAARAAVRTPGDARSAADAATRDAGGDAQAALRRGTAQWLLGRLREAAVQLAKAGDSPQANLVRGRNALEDADPLGAVAAFANLSGSSVADPDLEVEIATARALSGDGEGARSAAGRIGGGRKADSLYAEGVALDADGKHIEAKAKFEAAVEADGNHARALFRLAHAHDLAGEDESAMELYRRAAAVEPPHVNALMNLGLLLEDHDRFAEAESLYRRVLSGDPMHERARLYLKDVLAAQTMYFDEDNERKEDRRNQILRTPISEFELSVRSRNCLAKMEIKTLGDLITKTEAELLAYKNFGETSLQEIKDILAQKGLRLGMGIEDGLPLASKEEAEAELDAMFGGGRDDDDDLDEEDEVAPSGTDPRNLPIEKLELSIRARRAIEALELETVGDLADRTASELMENKNFGQTSLAEVTKKLAALGLALKGGGAPAAEEVEPE